MEEKNRILRTVVFIPLINDVSKVIFNVNYHISANLFNDNHITNTVNIIYENFFNECCMGNFGLNIKYQISTNILIKHRYTNELRKFYGSWSIKNQHPSLSDFKIFEYNKLSLKKVLILQYLLKI